MFVVFEGIDGSGKTTVSNLVAERLRAAGLAIKHLRAEGKFVSRVSESIRDLGRDARNLELVPQAEFLLYLARDVQLIEEALRPALRENDVVIADRFLYTAEVLARSGRGLSRALTGPVVEAVAGGLAPDLVVLVDVDPVLARARRKAQKLAARDRRPPARKGLAGVGLQHRLRRGYLDLAESDPDRWVVVSNEEALEDTVTAVYELIASSHQKGARETVAAFRRNRAARPTARRGLSEPTPSAALKAFLAWVDHRMEREPRVAAYLLGGLHGPSIDDRRRQLSTRVPEALLSAMNGLVDETSWRLRAELEAAHPGAVVRSLSGLAGADPRGRALLQRLEERAPAEVVATLSKRDDADAWRVREQLYASMPLPVVASLGGLSTERAWELRGKWLAQVGGDPTVSFEIASAAARSISGLDDEAAWRLRDQVRPVAPVAALSSVNGLTSPRSWQWRQELLAPAPRPVMLTMRRISHPEAWRMRVAVAPICKEALDSIADMDDREAWDLRDAHQDTWPSTVVKTLGPLADSARGQGLVERQLRRYGDNVSLLKHAAAIALGLHRGVPGSGAAPEG